MQAVWDELMSVTEIKWFSVNVLHFYYHRITKQGKKVNTD